LNFALHSFRSGLVGFVDGEDVRDLHDACLDGLNVVSHSRR
jgi:hypothetical protein